MKLHYEVILIKSNLSQLCQQNIAVESNGYRPTEFIILC